MTATATKTAKPKAPKRGTPDFGGYPIEEVPITIVDPRALNIHYERNYSRGQHKPTPTESIKEMAASMKRRQLQPCIARRLDDGKIDLIAGFRRAFAALWAMEPGSAEDGGVLWPDAKLQVRILPVPISDEEAAAINIDENLHKEMPEPMDEARGFAYLMETHGYSERKLAERFNVGRTTIFNRLALLKLPTVVQDQVADGTVPFVVATAISKLPEAEMKPVVDEIVDRGIAMNVDNVREIVKEHKERKARAYNPDAPTGVARTVKQVRTFLESQTSADADDEGSEFAKTWLDWIGGELADSKMLEVWRATFGD